MVRALQTNPYARWVEVDEALPPNRQDVLAMKVSGMVFKAWYEPSERQWYNNIGSKVQVNYWCKMESEPERNPKHIKKTP